LSQGMAGQLASRVDLNDLILVVLGQLAA